MSLPTYPGYKDSGVDWLGTVPEHWDSKRLKFLFDLVKREIREEDRIVTCFRDGAVTLRDNRRTDGFTNAVKEIGYQGIRVGDLVIHAMDAFAGAIGVSDSDGKSTPVYSVCTPVSPSVSSNYYARLLRNMAVAGFVSSLAKGIRERSTDFRWADAGEIFLPVPSETEQRKIVSFLDHETARIDALIEEQQRLIELLKEKRQAVISHTVTKGLDPTVPMKDSGVEWLGEVPAHWEVSRLKYHSTRIGDGLHSTPEYDDAGDYFFINGNNLVGGAITISPTTRQVNRQEFLKHRVLLDSSTILISINGTIGNLALYSGEPVILGKSAAYINCTESLSPRFCLYLFSSEQIKRFFESQLTGTTIYNLSLRTIAEIPTPLPSIDEQNSIIEFLNRNVDGFDELIDNAMKLAQLLQERRSALISAAVTGKIDVRGWQPPASASSSELAEEAA